MQEASRRRLSRWHLRLREVDLHDSVGRGGGGADRPACETGCNRRYPPSSSRAPARTASRVGAPPRPHSRSVRPSKHRLVMAQWTVPAQSRVHVIWARDMSTALSSFSSGRYMFKFLSEENADTIRAAFGENYPRLAAVKKNTTRRTLCSQPERKASWLAAGQTGGEQVRVGEAPIWQRSRWICFRASRAEQALEKRYRGHPRPGRAGLWSGGRRSLIGGELMRSGQGRSGYDVARFAGAGCVALSPQGARRTSRARPRSRPRSRRHRRRNGRP